MRCPKCRYGIDQPGCRMCHFVHDHIDLLDGTVASSNTLHFTPAPWESRPSLRSEIAQAWASYPTDPHALETP